MPKRRLMVCALLVSLLMGCSHQPNAAGTVAGPTHGSSPTDGIPSNVTPDEGTLVLAQVPMSQTPDYSTSGLAAQPGDLEITSICTGGTITLTVSPLNTFFLPCAADTFTPTRNIITLSRSTVVQVRIQAKPGARWNLLVALRPPVGPSP